MKKLSITCVLATAALMACTTSDENTASPAKGESGKDFVAGKLVYESELSETAKFSVYREKDGYMKAIESHMDRDKDIIPALEDAMMKESLEETYNALGAIKPQSGAMPAEFAELDKQSAQAAQAPEGIASKTAEGEQSGIGPEPTKALAKSSGEPEWDWEGDATWFKNVVRSDSPLQKEYFKTNITWGYVQRNGFQHTSAGMAASHIAKARFRTWRESCGLFSCDWDDGVDKTLEPRTYYIVRYNNNASQAHVLRKAQIDGKDPSKRVHLGMMYNTTKNYEPSKSDVSGAITSFKADNLTWVITNKGSVAIYKPVVRLTLTPTTGQSVFEETINVNLLPGQTYTRKVYVPSPMFHAVLYVDPYNAVSESNELNNIVSANEGN
jgi:hypothetical protein